MAIVDEVRARLNDSVDFMELLDAVKGVVDLWVHPDDRDEDDTMYTFTEGYCEALDNAVDVIAAALGLTVE